MFVILPHHSHDDGIKPIIINTQHIQTIYEWKTKLEQGSEVLSRIEFASGSYLLVPIPLIELLKRIREVK